MSFVVAHRFIVSEEPAGARAREADMFGGHLSDDDVTAHQDVHLVVQLLLRLLINQSL